MILSTAVALWSNRDPCEMGCNRHMTMGGLQQPLAQLPHAKSSHSKRPLAMKEGCPYTFQRRAVSWVEVDLMPSKPGAWIRDIDGPGQLLLEEKSCSLGLPKGWEVKPSALSAKLVSNTPSVYHWEYLTQCFLQRMSGPVPALAFYSAKGSMEHPPLAPQ